MATGDPVATGSEQVTAPPTAPEAATGIQAPPEGAPDASRIPLPARPPEPAVVPESHLARVRFLDGVLVLLTLLFAFLCASFRASNTDLFLHLATGRLIAQGGYTIGHDPFTFTADGGWVNHSWLYDLVSYLIYNSAGEWGGLILVVLKALLVTLAAALMLKAGSLPGQRQWIPVLCTLLAVLAMSPRLLLQPHIVSVVLLALTLYLLTRPAGSRARWLLPLVCLAWVNLDAWFLLGPVTILLYLAGEALQQAQDRGTPEAGAASPGSVGELALPKPLSLAQLGLVLLASVAACLINPHHVRAFTVLPVGLLRTGAMDTLRADIFRGYFVSPFENVYFSPTYGLSVAGLAYFVLLGVSLFSFVATAVWNHDGLRYWRALVWLATAILSSWNVRAVPFFAVVAAPIASLNFLDLAVKILGAEPRPERRWMRLAVAGRVLTLLAAVALVALSVPGWLQAQPYHRRQVAWGVEIDPGLRDAAETVARWRDKEALPAGQRWFNTSPDVVYYFAWFCPGERFFIDGRLELFGDVAKDMVAARKSISGEDRPMTQEQADPGPPAWRRVFADRDVSFVAFYSPDLANSSSGLTSLERLYSNPDEFVPCYVEASTALFAWRQPRAVAYAGADKKQPPLNPRLPVDFNARAFGKDAVTAPPEAPRPAGAGPWWQQMLQAKGATPPEALTAVQQLKRFEGMAFRYQVENQRSYLATVAALLGGQTTAPGGALGVLLPARLTLTYNRELFPEGDRSPLAALAMDVVERFMRRYDSGPVASLYLAVRDARKGLAKNPDDITSLLSLSQAYRTLYYQTREFAASTVRHQGREIPVFPAVRSLRQAQTAAAAQGVLNVNPRLEQARAAHMRLASVFIDPQSPYFEAHVRHVKEVLRINKLLPVPPGIPRDQYADYIKGQEENAKNLEKQLKARRDQYEVDGSRFRKEDVMQRAALAAQQGLAETAVKLLLEADPKHLRDPNDPRQAPGLVLMLDLLFGLGRVDEVRQILGGDPDSGVAVDRRGFGMHPLGLPAYDWYQVQLGAVTGDYEGADKALAECAESVRTSPLYTMVLARLEITPLETADKDGDARLFAGMLAGLSVLDGAEGATRTPWYLVRSLPTKLFHARAPHALKRDEEHPVQMGVRFLQNRLELEAELWTLRGWLALEAGRIDQAKEYAAKAISLADVGGDGRGNRYLMPFRSQALAGLVQGLARNAQPRK
jgi:tetratricopeptide (TPR) repeat protein